MLIIDIFAGNNHCLVLCKETFANLTPIKVTRKCLEWFLEYILFVNWSYAKDLGVNPCFIEVTYEFIFSLYQLLELNIRNTRGNVLYYYRVDI